MATKKTSTSKALANYDAKLAEMAELYADKEKGTARGSFFQTQGGVLSFGGNALPNNEMAVIILDSLMENAYYEGDFDPNTPTPPSCYAFGADGDADAMAPHKEASNPQADGCLNCPMNQFGTSATGRGKACKNQRRLALIPAGTLSRNGDFTMVDDVDQIQNAEIAFLKIPVTSVKGFATYVQQLRTLSRKPPFGVITRVFLQPDQNTQYRVGFEQIEPVPADFLEVVLARQKEAEAEIAFPYMKASDVVVSRPAIKKGQKNAPVRRKVPVTVPARRPAPAVQSTPTRAPAAKAVPDRGAPARTPSGAGRVAAGKATTSRAPAGGGGGGKKY